MNETLRFRALVSLYRSILIDGGKVIEVIRYDNNKYWVYIKKPNGVQCPYFLYPTEGEENG